MKITLSLRAIIVGLSVLHPDATPVVCPDCDPHARAPFRIAFCDDHRWAA